MECLPCVHEALDLISSTMGEKLEGKKKSKEKCKQQALVLVMAFLVQETGTFLPSGGFLRAFFP